MEYSRPGMALTELHKIRRSMAGENQPNAATMKPKGVTPPPAAHPAPKPSIGMLNMLPSSEPSKAPKLSPEQEAIAAANRQARAAQIAQQGTDSQTPGETK